MDVKVGGIGVLVDVKVGGTGVLVGVKVGGTGASVNVAIGSKTVGMVGGASVLIGGIAVSIEAREGIAAGCSLGSVGGTGIPVGCVVSEGVPSEKRRTTAIATKSVPRPTEKMRGYFPAEGILIADISNPPPRMPIKRKIAPMARSRPSLVLGIEELQTRRKHDPPVQFTLTAQL